MKKNKGLLILDIAVLLLSAALCFGTKLLFHACGAKEDGGWMNCHWAERAVFAIGLALTVSGVLLCTVSGRKQRAGIALGMVPAALTAAFLPQNVIPLCMMTTMRCHSVMRPAVIVLGCLIAVCALTDNILSLKAAKEDGRA